MAETDNLKRVFNEQRGEFIELFTQYGDENYAKEMEFVVEMLVNKNIKDACGNEVELKYTRLRYELSIARVENVTGIQDIKVIKENLLKIAH